MKLFIGGAALAALIATPMSAAVAGATFQPAGAIMRAAEGDLTLNAGTPITLAVAEEVNSSTHRAGDHFKLLVLNDVKVGDVVVIPKGTPAVGEITWRTGKGAFGKSGKIEFSLSYIELNGQRIPITGTFRQEGEGNTVATGVGVIAIGVFAGFITGKRARLPVGRELMSQVASTVLFTSSGQLSASYDSATEMAKAEAATPLGRCQAAARAIQDKKKQDKAIEKCFSERME